MELWIVKGSFLGREDGRGKMEEGRGKREDGRMEDGRMEEGKVGRGEGWKEEAQSRMNVLQIYQMDGVGERVMMDEGVWRKIAQSRMNVLQIYQMDGVG